jgi:DNA repair protein RadC
MELSMRGVHGGVRSSKAHAREIFKEQGAPAMKGVIVGGHNHYVRGKVPSPEEEY